MFQQVESSRVSQRGNGSDDDEIPEDNESDSGPNNDDVRLGGYAVADLEGVVLHSTVESSTPAAPKLWLQTCDPANLGQAWYFTGFIEPDDMVPPGELMAGED